ncbi:MAG: protein kinase [Bacteroidota bacterium]
MIGKTISHYQILEKLGEGGMGVVYKAEDTKLKRTVALKFLPPEWTRDAEAKARFIHEAQAASALEHNNICNIHEIDETEYGQLFIAMACYEGESLKQKIDRGPLKVEEAIDMAVQIAQGLDKAHQKKIVHRDLKPANVLVTEDGVAKIVDFGLAKLAGQTMLTQEGTTLGTVAYMSPEQTEGQDVDHRTDIWALGVALYEMLTGKLPFVGEYAPTVIYSIVNEDPEPITGLRTGVPMELERIVDKCLAKSADERYQHADELLADLKKLKRETEATSKTQAPGYTTAVRPATPGRRYRFVLGPAIILSLAIITVLGYFFLKRDEKPIAIDQQNSIAVMYFENLTGDPALDWIEAGMVEMLTANLGRFENLNVLSSQRLFDIMRQVSGKAATQVDRATATRIAEKAGVRIMLLGSVIGTQSQMRLNAQLVEVATGRLVGSEVLDAGSNGSLFSVVDSLTYRMADRLNIQSPDQPVEANVAYTLTNSPEALRMYVEGTQELYRSRYARAITQFEAAVKADSTFAMAYYHLATARGWQGGVGKRQALERARQYMDKVSEREQLLIEALLLQDFQEKRKAFEQIVARYPNEKFAWYELCELLFHSHWLQAGAKASLRAVELDPNFLLAYIHPIDYYMATGRSAEATPLLARAISLDSLNINFQFYKAYLNSYQGNKLKARAGFAHVLRLAGADSMGMNPVLARAYPALMERDYKKAEAVLGAYRKKATGYHVLFATNALAALAAFQGKYELAERILRQAVEVKPNSVFLTYETGLFALLRGKSKVTRTNGQQLVDWHSSGAQPFVEVATLGRHLLFLTALAESDMEKVQRAIAELRTLVVGQENAYDFLYYDALGRRASQKKNLQDAQKYFTQALTTATFFSTDAVISFRILIQDGLMECLERGRAYQTLLQHADESFLATGQIIPPHPYFLFSPSTFALLPRTLLRKAHAYEALGQKQKAIETYEAFLEIWKDADEDLPELLDAKARLAELKGMSKK